ncbi:hypothetical protein DFH08DRAFT_1078900 [Mycena albidolilacea]|uniref:Uncharacterized protein n=1 Tax=Mycena albidolilacea TaxID=1033008 RepID=A0AAD7A6Y0_9AGAR|nr:hypothetical protein DFH08DRAFT_1078900 [Mycena albidolilacea]
MTVAGHRPLPTASQRSSKPEAEPRRAPNKCPVRCSLPHPRAPTPTTTSRQLPAAGLKEAAPRCRRESVAFPAPRPRERELPHEHLARQQEAAARLATLTLLTPSPMLSQEVRNEVPAISLALGTSPPPRAHDIDDAALDDASDGPPHTLGSHTA